jgi:hypothetical protein
MITTESKTECGKTQYLDGDSVDREQKSANKRFFLAALFLLLIWIPCCFGLYSEIQTKGCSGTMMPFEYVVKYFNEDPAGVRLEQPFEVWIDKLNVSDCSWYMRAGLAYASGHGISVKSKSAGKEVYIPYTWQGAGTPFLIGTSVKLFGDRVFPYFLFACAVHWLAAFGVMALARKFTPRASLAFLAGLLSLLCFPVLNYDFGFGLMQSELPVEPLFVMSLLVLQWTFNQQQTEFKRALWGAVAFGVLCGLMSYIRPSYGAFGIFSAVLICAFSFRSNSRSTIVFLVATAISVGLVQLPWILRTEKAIGRAVMCGSQYRANTYGRAHWMNWKMEAMWCPDCCIGLGNYIDPARSVAILSTESVQPNMPITKQHDQVIDMEYKELARVVWRHPLKALSFKFSGYDVFWLGYRAYTPIRLYCFVSLAVFLLYAWRRKGRIPPEIYVFPAFVLLLSFITHYAPRYVYPFHHVVTPLCFVALIQLYLDQRKAAR